MCKTLNHTYSEIDTFWLQYILHVHIGSILLVIVTPSLVIDTTYTGTKLGQRTCQRFGVVSKQKCVNFVKLQISKISNQTIYLFIVYFCGSSGAIIATSASTFLKQKIPFLSFLIFLKPKFPSQNKRVTSQANTTHNVVQIQLNFIHFPIPYLYSLQGVTFL